MPMPSTILATRICATPYELACKIAPAIIMTTPIEIDLRRPSRSPMKLVAMAPTKHPISYYRHIFSTRRAQRNAQRYCEWALTMATMIAMRFAPSEVFASMSKLAPKAGPLTKPPYKM
jgi:hypothetical protein